MEGRKNTIDGIEGHYHVRIRFVNVKSVVFRQYLAVEDLCAGGQQISDPSGNLTPEFFVGLKIKLLRVAEIIVLYLAFFLGRSVEFAQDHDTHLHFNRVHNQNSFRIAV